MNDRRGIGRLGKIDQEPAGSDQLTWLENFLRKAAPFSSPLNGPDVRQRIPDQAEEGSARIPFSGPDQFAAEGYVSEGSNRPQSGSNTGAPSTSQPGSQTGSDSEGHTPELDSYTANTITANEGDVEAYTRAFAAGRLQARRGVLDGAQVAAFAQDHATRYGTGLDDNSREILRQFYLAGFVGEAGCEFGDSQPYDERY